MLIGRLGRPPAGKAGWQATRLRRSMAFGQEREEAPGADQAEKARRHGQNDRSTRNHDHDFVRDVWEKELMRSSRGGISPARIRTTILSPRQARFRSRDR